MSAPTDRPPLVTPAARVAVVTGGLQGLGAAIVDRLTSDGWQCVILDREAAIRGGDGDELTPSPVLMTCDVSSSAQVDDAVGSTVEMFGRIDAVVNNAGFVRPAPSHEVSDEDWSSLIDVHLGGSMRLCRASVRGLLSSESPAIVNISSVCAARGFPGRLSYNAAKAGIEALTRTLAVEWGAFGIRVNAVAPGFILTENSRKLYESGVADATARASLVPLGRLGRPEEIADAVRWLISPQSSYVTGQVIVVDGGYLASGRTGADPTDRSREEIAAELGIVTDRGHP